MIMTRVIAVVACSLGLAACSSWNTSWMQSFDLFSSKPTIATLTIESDPPGAEARTSLGGTCRTPCALPVPVADEFTVSYALNGYLPQTVPVRPLTPESGFFGSSGSTALLDPNPVFAALRPAAPPPKPAPPKRRPRPNTARAAPPSDSAPPPPSMGGFAPPPGAFTPAPGTIR
jgi:hypothetical protein